MKVYIAGPYSSDHAAGVRNAVRAGNIVRDMGHCPFIPHLTHFWDIMYPREYEDWLAYDLEWLAECDVLILLPGSSAGAAGEVNRAFELEISVVRGLARFSAWLEAKNDRKS